MYKFSRPQLHLLPILVGQRRLSTRHRTVSQASLLFPADGPETVPEVPEAWEDPWRFNQMPPLFVYIILYNVGPLR